ncbi:septation protein A [Mangrovibrevibacter kandeliae]|uniref:septation protein A n=1 Tax=Mangrovibrevibacter kandeliae TaxID=2968473 RepID=UPI002117C3DF|nr:septation protein A [Aurantimonas sp. CSK15Z-1]MCQ8783675.1 septation protein A [Aurantimonas sp. CSK15Z-1]
MPHHILEDAPNAPPRKPINPLLKLALELGPLVLFFFANARQDAILKAVPALAVLGDPRFVPIAVFMVAVVAALAVSWALTRRLSVMPLVSGVFVLGFGFLTFYLQDETFFQMKPTIVNGLFAAILLGGLLFGRSLLGYVFDEAFKLDDEGWRILTLRWGLFFVFLAILNEVVWRNVAYDTWVDFKVWGTMPITILFTLCQLPLLKRHSLEEETAG